MIIRDSCERSIRICPGEQLTTHRACQVIGKEHSTRLLEHLFDTLRVVSVVSEGHT